MEVKVEGEGEWTGVGVGVDERGSLKEDNNSSFNVKELEALGPVTAEIFIWQETVEEFDEGRWIGEKALVAEVGETGRTIKKRSTSAAVDPEIRQGREWMVGVDFNGLEWLVSLIWIAMRMKKVSWLQIKKEERGRETLLEVLQYC